MLFFACCMQKKLFWQKKSCSVWFQRHVIHVYLRKFKMGQIFYATTCWKIDPSTINPCKTKMFFPEYSFHINFTKKQEISAKLNDSVKSYNKKTKREGAGGGYEEGGVGESPLWIWSHLLMKYLIENFIFCAMGQFQLFLSQSESIQHCLYIVFRLSSFISQIFESIIKVHRNISN